MKHEPKVGEHLYTYTPSTYYYVQLCKDPWTVIDVKGNTCTVQEAGMVFNGPRYYNTLPDGYYEDPNGRTMKLRYNAKKDRWEETPRQTCTKVAVFGEWRYQPYLD